MLSKEDIENNITKDSFVQVVVADMPPIAGQFKLISDTSILIAPYNDKAMIEQYGEPVSVDTLIPIEIIQLIFKLDKEEDGSKN